MRLILIAMLCSVLMAQARAEDDIAPPKGQLLKMVVVSRHGVRSPLSEETTLASWTTRGAWPVWPTSGRGMLTDRGAELAAVMGGYYRAHTAQAGLFPSTGCPDPNAVFIRADIDQRTVATAQAIARGFAPACGIEVHVASPSPDPLFHPIKARVCAIDAKQAKDAILARLPEGFAGLDRKYSHAIGLTQNLLQCCQPDICSRPGADACCKASACAKSGDPMRSCTLPNIPTGLDDGKDGLKLCGAIGIGSTASEIFLLEYAQGFHDKDVAWGELNREHLSQLFTALGLHNEQFDLMERTPYLAERQGSMLLRAVLNALQGDAASGPYTGPMPPMTSAFTAFIGHDTNIANLGAMMQADWSATSRLPDKTAPAGALVFELRLQTGGMRDVYVYYQAQSVEQMRDKSVLTTARAPVKKPLHLARCSRAEPGGPCEFTKFKNAINHSLRSECLK